MGPSFDTSQLNSITRGDLSMEQKVGENKLMKQLEVRSQYGMWWVSKFPFQVLLNSSNNEYDSCEPKTQAIISSIATVIKVWSLSFYFFHLILAECAKREREYPFLSLAFESELTLLLYDSASPFACPNSVLNKSYSPFLVNLGCLGYTSPSPCTVDVLPFALSLAPPSPLEVILRMLFCYYVDVFPFRSFT